MNQVELELRHILLEVQAQRGQHLRHFVDQWFCYKNGYINRSGKAKWKDIAWAEYVSPQADETRDFDQVIHKEHIVPLKVIAHKLIALGKDATLDQIEAVLTKYLRFATITKAEDKILNSNGLNQKMPEEFYDPHHQLHDDVFARYKVTGIELRNNKK